MRSLGARMVTGTEGARRVGQCSNQDPGLRAEWGGSVRSDCRNGLGMRRLGRKLAKEFRLVMWSGAGNTKVSGGLGGTEARVRWEAAWSSGLGAQEAMAFARFAAQTLGLPQPRA